MWGFLNTVQIIFFMPLLSHYFPAHLKQFLTYLSSAKMEMDLFDARQKLQIIDPFDFDISKCSLLNYL